MSHTQSLPYKKILKSVWIETLLGSMLAIADEELLYLLEFAGRKELDKEIERMQKKLQALITPGYTAPIQSIENELKQYFEGRLKTFKTPLFCSGTTFQKRVWQELQQIPFGETRSYSSLASTIGRPSAFRAVAQANGSNQLAIIIPCHRVISASGELSGYAGGVEKKKWLLNHESIL